MKQMHKPMVGVIVSCLMGLAAGCGRQPACAATDTITVGSKNFTEQLILGELMAQTIEANTTLTVKRLFNLGGTMICHEGLVRGELDLYAEYTGTALTAILKKGVVADPTDAFHIVSTEYASRHQCEWLQPFGFNNTYAITVRRDAAERHGWNTISDLKGKAAALTAGFTAEFMEREDGYTGLQKAYGITFGDARDMEPSLMYDAVAHKRVDIICAFATDGRIAAFDLRKLKDDKRFFPPYYAAPVVRQETLNRHPEIGRALNRLGGMIDDDTMRRLNNEVDQKKRAPAEVVETFLRSRKRLH